MAVFHRNLLSGFISAVALLTSVLIKHLMSCLEVNRVLKDVLCASSVTTVG